MNKKIWIPKYNYYSKRLSMWQEKFWREVNGKPFMGILDNVAGRRTFEYATFGRSGIQQSNSKLFRISRPKQMLIQKAVSSFPYGTVAAASGSLPALTTQIDRGQREYDTLPGTGATPVYAYGFAGDANNWHGVTAFGVMDSVTYTDGGATSRTIRSVYDTEDGGSGGGDLYFSLDTASVSNSDTTFTEFTWDNTAGTPVSTTRAEMSYTASLNGDTHWRDLTPNSSWLDVDANTDFVLTTG